MDCLRCGKPAEDRKALCEDCAALPRSAVPDEILRGPRQSLAQILRPFLWVPFVLVALVFLLSSRGFSPVSVQGITMLKNDGTKTGLCQNRKGCLLVFLAPWCGACRGSVGFINELRTAARQSELGFEIVVGWDSKEEVRKFGREIKGTVFYDDEGIFKKAAKPTSVPRWYAIDSEQKLFASFNPAYPSGAQSKDILRYIVAKNAAGLSDLVAN